MNDAIKSVGSRFLAPVAALAAVTLPQASQAALDPAVTGMFTSLAADFALYLAAGFGLLAIVVAGTVGLGWGKKIAKKVAA